MKWNVLWLGVDNAAAGDALDDLELEEFAIGVADHLVGSLVEDKRAADHGLGAVQLVLGHGQLVAEHALHRCEHVVAQLAGLDVLLGNGALRVVVRTRCVASYCVFGGVWSFIRWISFNSFLRRILLLKLVYTDGWLGVAVRNAEQMEVRADCAIEDAVVTRCRGQVELDHDRAVLGLLLAKSHIVYTNKLWFKSICWISSARTSWMNRISPWMSTGRFVSLRCTRPLMSASALMGNVGFSSSALK